MGVWVREGFCFRVRPAGIIGSFRGLENAGANDLERSASLPAAEVLEDVGIVTARSWEVVVKRRFGGVRNGCKSCARASL